MPETNRPGVLSLRLALLLALVAGTALVGCPAPASRLPDRTIVLTFDDCARSHLTFVAPTLKEYGFDATFFVTACWEHDRENFHSLEEATAIHEMGFEIAGHSYGHLNLGHPRAEEWMAGDFARLENTLEGLGIPRPRTFAWPFGFFGPEAREMLISRGYAFARRGAAPNAPPGTKRIGHHYDPKRHDPLLIPSALTLSPEITLEDMRTVIAGARNGKAAVLQFHGVPDTVNPVLSTDPRLFRQFLDLFREENCNVIAFRDLARWVDSTARPEDPHVGARLW